jgi:hypothetical protein
MSGTDRRLGTSGRSHRSDPQSPQHDRRNGGSRLRGSARNVGRRALRGPVHGGREGLPRLLRHAAHECRRLCRCDARFPNGAGSHSVGRTVLLGRSTTRPRRRLDELPRSSMPSSAANSRAASILRRSASSRARAPTSTDSKRASASRRGRKPFWPVSRSQSSSEEGFRMFGSASDGRDDLRPYITPTIVVTRIPPCVRKGAAA